MDKHKRYSIIIFGTVLLAFGVVELGALTRLMNAGLGCPDWPGCYGHWQVPNQQDAINAFPNQPLNALKALMEMIHRYFASTLATMILIFTAIQTRIIYKKKLSFFHQPKIIYTLFLLIIMQASLGMWTVTLKLHPTIVMLHLIGGFSTLSLLWLLFLNTKNTTLPNKENQERYKYPAAFATLVLTLQILLGGWTSANYASLVCPSFPYCNLSSELTPAFDFINALNFLQPLDINYFGGNLSFAARVTIQMMHRFGALLTTLVIITLCCHILFKSNSNSLKKLSLCLLFLTGIQVTLGIMNVIQSTPLSIALLHNATASCLLIALLTLVYYTWKTPAKSILTHTKEIKKKYEDKLATV